VESTMTNADRAVVVNPRRVWALVRSRQDLARVRNDLSDFFATLIRHSGRESPTEDLIGIWINAPLAKQSPHLLTVRCRSTPDRHIDVRQTAALSGIWTVCWLEQAQEQGPIEVSRLDVLSALVASSGRDQPGGPPSRFVPVFRNDVAARAIHAELDNLREHHPMRLMTPWLQDPASGRLSTANQPDGQPIEL